MGSRSGEIALEFGGEERVFRLGLGQWRKIQETCDAGPPELLSRLAPAYTAARNGLTFEQIVAMGYLGTWRIDDVREVIRQGLLGAIDAAGKPLRRPEEVTVLVRDWVDERPWLESAVVAYQILLAGWIGPDDERAVGEPPAAEPASPTSPAASSGSEKTASTPSAAPSP